VGWRESSHRNNPYGSLKGLGHQMNILLEQGKRKPELSIHALMVFKICRMSVEEKIKYADFAYFYGNTY
jgi:hypothetical protein